jgi:hypothetical protein
MSLVFDFEFQSTGVRVRRKTKTVNKNVSPSSQKLVMLALADHANDEGEGAYPSLTTLCKKTCLTRPTVSITLRCLKSIGLLKRVGVSKRGTTNYTINTGETGLLGKPEVVYLVNQEVVYQVNPNHPINRTEPSLGAQTARPTPNDGEKVRHRHSTSKTTSNTPPAISAYRESAKAFPAKAQWPAIVAAVGDESDRLDLWRKVVSAYILCGWNPRNVAGMLEFFRRGDIPKPGNGHRKNGRQETDWSSIDVDEMNRKLASGEI